MTFTVKGTPRPGAQAGDRRSSRTAAPPPLTDNDVTVPVTSMKLLVKAPPPGPVLSQRQGQAFESLPLLLTRKAASVVIRTGREPPARIQ